MRKKIWVFAVSLASMAGLLLVSGVAWAQAEETPVKVRVLGCERLEEPERYWVDEDGIEHARDTLIICWAGRDMVGELLAWTSWDADPATGHMFQHGYYSFTGSILGEPATGVGRFTKERNCIEGVCINTQEDVMHLAGGGLWIVSGSWESGASRIIFQGVLIDPPGGAKRQGPRPRR